jgi:hypothetical protein
MNFWLGIHLLQVSGCFNLDCHFQLMFRTLKVHSSVIEIISFRVCSSYLLFLGTPNVFGFSHHPNHWITFVSCELLLAVAWTNDPRCTYDIALVTPIAVHLLRAHTLRCLTFLDICRFCWSFWNDDVTFRSIIEKMPGIHSPSNPREFLVQSSVWILALFLILVLLYHRHTCVNDARTCCLVWLDLCVTVQSELYLCKRISRTCIALTSCNHVISCSCCQVVQALPNIRNNIVLPFRVLFSSCLAILEQWTRRRRHLFLDQVIAVPLMCRTERLLTAPEVHRRRFAGLARTDSVNHHQQWLLIHLRA